MGESGKVSVYQRVTHDFLMVFPMFSLCSPGKDKLRALHAKFDKNGDGKARDPSFEEGIRHSLLQ